MSGYLFFGEDLQNYLILMKDVTKLLSDYGKICRFHQHKLRALFLLCACKFFHAGETLAFFMYLGGRLCLNGDVLY
jgi:hypothetical protein